VSLRRVKALGRRLQEWLERGILGTRLQEWIWRSRHLYRHGWAQGYLGTISHPHRNQIVEAVSLFSPLDSVLEVGCASGANLVNLRERLPGTRLIGIDINRQAIDTAKRHFAARRDKKIRLLASRVDLQTDIPNASVDVVAELARVNRFSRSSAGVGCWVGFAHMGFSANRRGGYCY